MTTTITLSSQAIRARVQALSALRSLASDDTPPLPDDSSLALNQLIVFHFYRVTLPLAPWIVNVIINPPTFVHTPAEDLMMTVEFTTHDATSTGLPWNVIAGDMEEIISDLVCADLFAAPGSAAYTSRADWRLDSLRQLFEQALPASMPLRLQRS